MIPKPETCVCQMKRRTNGHWLESAETEIHTRTLVTDVCYCCAVYEFGPYLTMPVFV